MLPPTSSRYDVPRLDSRIRAFAFRGSGGGPKPPVLATTIAVHVELRVEGDLVLKRNYLSEVRSEGGYDALWVSASSLGHAIVAGTADMTKQVVPDVVDVLRCGSLRCNRRTPSDAPAAQ